MNTASYHSGLRQLIVAGSVVMTVFRLIFIHSSVYLSLSVVIALLALISSHPLALSGYLRQGCSHSLLITSSFIHSDPYGEDLAWHVFFDSKLLYGA